jgi:hypothetical protein
MLCFRAERASKLGFKRTRDHLASRGIELGNLINPEAVELLPVSSKDVMIMLWTGILCILFTACVDSSVGAEWHMRTHAEQVLPECLYQALKTALDEFEDEHHWGPWFDYDDAHKHGANAPMFPENTNLKSDFSMERDIDDLTENNHWGPWFDCHDAPNVCLNSAFAMELDICGLTEKNHGWPWCEGEDCWCISG